MSRFYFCFGFVSVVGVVAGLCAPAPAAAQDIPASSLTVTETTPWPEAAGQARLVVQMVRAGQPEQRLAVRAIVKDSGGRFADGSDHGVYADGRFFAEGSFAVTVPPGRTCLELRCGPDYVPLIHELDLPAGQTTAAVAAMHRWFNPHDLKWFDGDNHVHAQHDDHAAVRTDLPYTALQGRANGLSYLTEAGSAGTVSYEKLAELSDAGFLLRIAGEIRPGPFLGHFNPPGIREPIRYGILTELTRSVLPHHAIGRQVRERGGVMIHTHPTTPPQQLHWMGAAILMADAVLGTTPEALDQDYPATQALWFAALNLGNRIAASGSTDAALGRKNTPSPGDRRIYSRAEEFTYESIVDGIRRGRTFATNGGPLFAFLKVGEHEVGETAALSGPFAGRAVVEVHALNPLKKVVLYANGVEKHVFAAAGQRGHLKFAHDLDFPAAQRVWIAARAESQNGDWAMTSPVYFEPAAPAPQPFASLRLLQISNATRFSTLSKDFFAHLLVTIRPQDELVAVELLRDGEVIRRFDPAEPEQKHEGRVPVTEGFGSYGPGWVWHQMNGKRVHFQADWPVQESGHYALRAVTVSGRRLESDVIHHDAANPDSHQIGAARLEDGFTQLAWWGYGQEAPLAQLPEGDHWWFPKNMFWRITTVFGGQKSELSGGNPALAGEFRRLESRD